MLEKFGTFEIWECGGCGDIVHRQLGEGLPTCICMEDKLASGEAPIRPAWMHRKDLEEKIDASDE